ncbi:hypothetical protein AMTRI_Chr12g267020 [Amborella trichopoda]
MEDNVLQSSFADAKLVGITFCLASSNEIRTSSVNECPISHSSQLLNPFLGLPVESGRCDSCGSSDIGECEGHFGYIQLPQPIYHPSHISEVRRILSLVCLNCLKPRKKKAKFNLDMESSKFLDASKKSCLYCEVYPPISVKEIKKTDGAYSLELKLPSRREIPPGFWKFLDKYGYHYGDSSLCRPLLAYEARQILKNLPERTVRWLAEKGSFPQSGLIIDRVAVPPNCLCIPDFPQGKSSFSSSPAIASLKKLLVKADIITKSRSGIANFESHEIEANDLQSTCSRYFLSRSSAKESGNFLRKVGVPKVVNESSARLWLEKMRMFFISKGSGFSSRSVITGDAYMGINQIGLPLEIARKITFEEKVTSMNKDRLQSLLDRGLCLTFKDGQTTYVLRDSSKGSKSLKIGNVINRRIVDGDIVFINRPPSTHKHSIQAFSVYVHEDSTIKINPLICEPFGADFDGDCIHIFYPQSLAARAEAIELFSVEQQLLSSHSGSLNVKFMHDSLLSAKLVFKTYFVNRATVQQLSMWTLPSFIEPAIVKARDGPLWTVLQLLQSGLPSSFDCSGPRYLISHSEILEMQPTRDQLPPLLTEILNSIVLMKGPKEALKVFNSLQPLFMEILFMEGYSIGLGDFNVPKPIMDHIKSQIKSISPLLKHMRSTDNELIESQVAKSLDDAKLPIVKFILKSSSLGGLIDSSSSQAVNKVVEQIGFLGLQLFSRGKYYTKDLVDDLISFIQSKHVAKGFDYPTESFGLIKSCLFHGLNPYEELVYSVSVREGSVRSSKGLSEPGILFKHLMAVLRDVVICYDGTVRNVCSNLLVQFEYGGNHKTVDVSASAGEPVGILAATAVSNPAYAAVLSSSQSNTSSWNLMKEILFCKQNSSEELDDRRVVVYLQDCHCGKKYCKENMACMVQRHLKGVPLKDFAAEFFVVYDNQIPTTSEIRQIEANLVGHIHLDKMQLSGLNVTVQDILLKVTNDIMKKNSPFRGHSKKLRFSSSEECRVGQASDGNWSSVPCLQFKYHDRVLCGDDTGKVLHLFVNTIYPRLLEMIVQGDSRVNMVNIIWIDPDAPSWVRKPCKKERGEIALEVVIDKNVVKQRGDAWRTFLDSCLPVMNLIDIKRSIPYGIKQIEEYLGISSAFDLTFQRLSKSLSKVAKGILREHLLLVADNMALTGKLVGFNTSGYKALFRSLKVPLPFTEATLYTPMKCFEKAAEGRNKDSLSGIVASCSWGKLVAVGTGTRFEVTWNNKQVEVPHEYSTDVYDFLHLVSTPGANEIDNSCLGMDVDNMNEDKFHAMSPEPLSAMDKPTFDGSPEVIDLDDDWPHGNGKFGKSSWDVAKSPARPSGGWGGWGVEEKSEDHQAATDNPNGWGGWGKGKSDKEKVEFSTVKSNGWEDGGDTSTKSGWEGAANSPPKSDGRLWGSEKENDGKDLFPTSNSNGWSVAKTPRNESFSTSGWEGAPKSPPKSEGWNWGSEKQNDDHEALPTDNSNGWGTSATKKPAEEGFSKSGWEGVAKSPKSDGLSWGEKQNDDKEGLPSNNSRGWESSFAKEPAKESFSKSGGEGATISTPNSDGWRWDSEKQNHDKEALPSNNSHGWGSSFDNKSAEKSFSKSGWEAAGDSPGKSDGWGWGSAKENDDKHDLPTSNSNGWGGSVAPKQAEEDETAFALAKQNDWEARSNDFSKSPPISSGLENWGTEKQKKDTDAFVGSSVSSGWGGEKNKEGSNAFAGPSVLGRWGGKKQNDNKAKEMPYPPGFNFGSPDNAPVGKFKRDGPPPPRPFRKRMDIYTTEEEKILSEVEPLMLSGRRILHNTRYKDGDRLSQEDESYILENIFHYHPDKAQKMGDSVDFVKIDQHSLHPGSRCFHIVSVNGDCKDFSYKKCIENFIREKYPEEAASFNKKYFPEKHPPRAAEAPSPSAEAPS